MEDDYSFIVILEPAKNLSENSALHFILWKCQELIVNSILVNTSMKVEDN
jgi:hypothetical protein